MNKSELRPVVIKLLKTNNKEKNLKGSPRDTLHRKQRPLTTDLHQRQYKLEENKFANLELFAQQNYLSKTKVTQRQIHSRNS